MIRLAAVPGAVGVAKGKTGHEVDSAHGVEGFLKLFLRFAGKADDKIGGQGDVGRTALSSSTRCMKRAMSYLRPIRARTRSEPA